MWCIAKLPCSGKGEVLLDFNVRGHAPFYWAYSEPSSKIQQSIKLVTIGHPTCTYNSFTDKEWAIVLNNTRPPPSPWNEDVCGALQCLSSFLWVCAHECICMTSVASVMLWLLGCSLLLDVFYEIILLNHIPGSHFCLLWLCLCWFLNITFHLIFESKRSWRLTMLGNLNVVFLFSWVQSSSQCIRCVCKRINSNGSI